ncbi:MAG: RidA family protein [Gemmatimonadaceae bacterium]
MSESRQATLAPAGWAPAKGYANGMVAQGRIVALAGQIGWNPATAAFESDDLVAQVRQALANVATLVREAGGEPAHVIRLTWFLTDRDGYLSRQAEIGAAYREVMGRHFPAMSVVIVAGLIESRALVEIEATAVLP